MPTKKVWVYEKTGTEYKGTVTNELLRNITNRNGIIKGELLDANNNLIVVEYISRSAKNSRAQTLWVYLNTADECGVIDESCLINKILNAFGSPIFGHLVQDGKTVAVERVTKRVKMLREKVWVYDGTGTICLQAENELLDIKKTTQLRQRQTIIIDGNPCCIELITVNAQKSRQLGGQLYNKEVAPMAVNTLPLLVYSSAENPIQQTIHKLSSFSNSNANNQVQLFMLRDLLDNFLLDSHKIAELLYDCAHKDILKKEFTAILQQSLNGISILHQIMKHLSANDRRLLFSTIPDCVEILLLSAHHKDLPWEFIKKELMEFFLCLPPEQIQSLLKQKPILWRYLFDYSFEEAMQVLDFGAEGFYESVMYYRLLDQDLGWFFDFFIEGTDVTCFYEKTQRILDYPAILSYVRLNGYGPAMTRALTDISYDVSVEILRVLISNMTLADFADICNWVAPGARGLSMFLFAIIEPAQLDELLRNIILREEIWSFAAGLLRTDEEGFSAVHAIIENESGNALKLLDVLKDYIPDEIFQCILTFKYEGQNVLEALTDTFNIPLAELHLRYLPTIAEIEEIEAPVESRKRPRAQEDEKVSSPAQKVISPVTLTESEYQNWSTFFSSPIVNADAGNQEGLENNPEADTHPDTSRDFTH